MACCGGHHNRRISKEIAKPRPDIAPLGDLVSVVFTGSEKDVFYGVSGNRYAVLPGETLEVDKADLERFIASGLFTVLD